MTLATGFTHSVRFTNDSCTACGNVPPNQDRNLYVLSASVGATTTQAYDAGVTCNQCDGAGRILGDGVQGDSGDVTFNFATPLSGAIAVTAYGDPDLGAYPHMQVLVNGALIGERDVTGSPQTYTIALPDAVSSTYFYLADHLGSAQMEFAQGGYPVWAGMYSPYGQEVQGGSLLSPEAYDGESSHYKFTGKERDAESGLDYFGARYYSSTAGRWMSPDWAAKPEAVPYNDLHNPQSLNLYNYVNNNPLSKADPDGHCCLEEAAQVLDEYGPSAVSAVQSTFAAVAGATVAIGLKASGALDSVANSLTSGGGGAMTAVPLGLTLSQDSANHLRILMVPKELPIIKRQQMKKRRRWVKVDSARFEFRRRVAKKAHE